MSFFACAVEMNGGSVPSSFAAAVSSASFAHGKRIEWHYADGFVAGIGMSESGMPARFARWHSVVGVGEVRLDNRTAIMKRVGDSGAALSDLDLAVRFIAEHGQGALSTLLGDFAFVVWDPTAGALVAACDAFRVRRLYYAPVFPNLLAFASRADLLAKGHEYDVQFLGEFIAGAHRTPGRTAFAGVLAVPPASVVRLAGRHLSVDTYWSPSDEEASATSVTLAREQIEHFRELLIESVRLRLVPGQQTWSLLSGGLDSSSVVSIAQWLGKRGAVAETLAGTVTYVDRLGTAADEREYSDAVAAHCGVRNETVDHQFDWRDIADDPPQLDQPGRTYLTAARDRQTLSLIRGSGGKVLLTGLGGDNLVLGTMFFFADWLVRGEVHRAVREMLHRAALGRVSFWKLAYLNALLPLMPAQVRRLLPGDADDAPLPAWLTTNIVRRYRLGQLVRSADPYAGRLGHKYRDSMLATVAAIPSTLHAGLLDEALDIRHPYLYRPLVEFALTLGPEMCVRPHARKWILREAMRGILPEPVRTRVGKGSSLGLATWPLIHERDWIAQLLRDPILAQLGCIDPRRLRDALSIARKGGGDERGSSLNVHATLDLEIWLQVRAGRWAADDSRTCTTRLASR